MAELNLLQLCRGQYGKIADIGAADGDLAFFLEKQGLSVDVIENESTNFNRLEGAQILKLLDLGETGPNDGILFRQHSHRQANGRRSASLTVPDCIFAGTKGMQQ